MAYPGNIREKARTLRAEKRLTIDELARRLAVPRTTVYCWVRDLPIGKTDRQTRAAYRAGQASRRIHRDRRQAAYAQGQAEYPALLEEPSFRDFVCMYIGEGYKRNRNIVAMGNSDPAVVRLGAYWIRRLSSNPVAFEFQHHADQEPEELSAFLGRAPGGGPIGDQVSAKVQQRGHGGSHLAFEVRRPDRAHRRYVLSRTTAGVDGWRSRRVALELTDRGVAQPGQSARFGGGRFRWFESSRPDHVDGRAALRAIRRARAAAVPALRRSLFRFSPCRCTACRCPSASAGPAPCRRLR